MRRSDMNDPEEPMSHQNQIEALGDELDSFIERFVLEYDLTPYDMIAALQVKAFLIMNEITEDKDERGIYSSED